MAQFYDGDTTYALDPRGIRVAGVNTPEMDTPTGEEARVATLMITNRAGMEPTGHIEDDTHGRSVQQFAAPDGTTLAQTLVNTGFGSAMSGDMAHGVNPTSNAARELLGLPKNDIESDPALQLLAEKARAERLEFLDRAILSGDYGRMATDPLRGVESPQQARGVVDRAWDRGVDNMQGTFYGFADALGRVTGIDALQEFGEEGVARNIWQALESPATVASYEDIDSLQDVGIYALEALVEFSPQIATDVLAAFASGGGTLAAKYGLAGVGKALLRNAGGPGALGGAKDLAALGLGQAAKRGAQGGALASMYAQSAGETQNQLVLEGVDSPETALAVGAAKAALDYAGLDVMLRSAFKGLSKEAVAPERISQMLGNAAKSAGVAATAESLTEATQTLMDEMAIMAHKPDHEVEWKQVADAMLKGGIAGGGIAGAGRAATDTVRMIGDSATRSIPAAGDPVQDTLPEPLRDIEAQIANTPAGEGNWYTAANAEEAKQVAAANGKAIKEAPDGSVFVGEEALVSSLPDAPTQADVAQFNGYVQTKDEALADPAGAVVVETRSAEGAVLRNQLVGKSMAQVVREQQQAKYPGAIVEEKPVEQAVQERTEAVEQERTAPANDYERKGLVAERVSTDLEALRARADAAGVSLDRFAPKPDAFGRTLGGVLKERLRTGLEAVVKGGGKRLDSVRSLAPLLDMDLRELERTYYDARNVIHGRDELFKAVVARIDEKYPSPSAFAEAVDWLPAAQADAIRKELGVDAPGGFNYERLVAEIEAREAKPVAPPDVDLDSPVQAVPAQATSAPAAKPTADRVANAVFNTPAIRQIVSRDGAPATADQIEEALDGMSAGQRMQLESILKKLDIDVGGANRESFLALLRDSVAEKAVYGIGKSRVDDEATDGAEEAVRTVEFDPSALDSEDARLYQLVAATPLADKAKNGWSAGLSLYLEAMGKIVKAGEPDSQVEQSALDDAEAVRMNHARILAAIAGAMVEASPSLDSDVLLAEVAKQFGITSELIDKASAGKTQDAVPALRAMAERSGRRVARGLLLRVARWIDTDPDALDGTAEDARRIADMTSLAESDPAATMAAMADALRSITRGEIVDDPIVLLPRDGNDARLSATAKGRDAGKGEDVAIDSESPFGEQQMSDDSFFGAVRRMSIQNWDVAIKPTAAQLSAVRFRNPISEQVTRKFGGANLLVLPALDGSPFGSVVDAVALAMYAQGGERVPASPGEAAVNLLENISRLMAGPQSSHDKFADRAKAVVRTIPDDLVIFVDPVKGRPVTFGEGLNHRHAMADAGTRQKQIERELDQLTDDIGVMADSLDTFIQVLWEKNADLMAKHPVAWDAIDRWTKMIAGEKDASGNYYRIPSEAENPKLRRAMVSISDQKIDGEKMGALYSRYLSALSQRKQLAQESAWLSQDMGAKRNPPTEEAVAALKADPDANLLGKRRERAIKDAMNSGGASDGVDAPRGREAFDGLGEQEFNPHAHDPLNAFGEDAMYDADDRAQQAAIEAWLASEGKPMLFRLASTVTAEQKPEKGMTVEEVEEVARGYLARFNGNLPLGLRVVATQEEAYGRGATIEEHGVLKGSYRSGPGRRGFFGYSSLRDEGAATRATDTAVAQDAYDSVPGGSTSVSRPAARSAVAGRGSEVGMGPGAFLGRVDLVAGNHRDAEDVIQTIRHEILGHFGLNTFAPEDKRAVLDRILKSKEIGSLRGIWRDIEVRYKGQSAYHQAEEVFAYIAEGTQSALQAFRSQLLAWLSAAARKIGLLGAEHVTRAELEVMLRQIAAGIRDGHLRQRNFPKTDGASFRRALPSAPMLVARGKQFWAKGVVPKAAPVFSMVYSRIARLHPELARALFQPAGSTASALGQSWEQRSRALKSRMMAQVDRTLTEIRQGKKEAAAALAVQAAFADAYSGSPKTADGAKVRRLVDQLVAEARRAGMVSVELGEGFAPVAFDRQAVASRAAEFQALLLDGAGVMPDEAREIMARIVDGPGTIEGAIAPGMPIGTHRTTKELMDAIGTDKLIAGGWMLAKHDAALFHWVDGAAKRASWEAIFGGEGKWTARDGKTEKGFDPNAKFKAMVDEAREKHGPQAAEEIMALVNGALGRHPAGQSMPGWWRSTQEFITGWAGMTVLAFSGVASIPELTLPLVRANGRVGLGEMLRDYQDAKRFARDMGIVLSDVSEQVMWQSTGDQYRSPLISKMQGWFFRLNGNELIVRTSRALATGVAIRYILSAAADGDTGSLERLGLDAGTVHAWDQAGKPVWNPELPDAERALAAKVTDAVNQFVNEATLNPSRFQATHWGNNPYLKMIWHLKHFLYTYGDTVLGGMWREMSRRWAHLDPQKFADAVAIASPALIFGLAVLPLAAASLEARDWIRRLNGGEGKEYQGAVDYMGDVFARAGGLGPVEFLFNMRQQQEWGASIFGSLAPVPAKIDMLFSDRDAVEKIRQMTPIWSQNKTMFGLLE